MTTNIPPRPFSVLVALSGGVDSAVVAHLLKFKGSNVSSDYMRTWQNDDGFGECPWREDLESARVIAKFLDIPFTGVSMIEKYRYMQEITDYSMLY
ncbi:MAG: hypothetical protein LBF26_01210 [Puniceicoccales bacterium]|jgi:tRNA-specific 2-thiouridylase|nr:hypothetical protein [Puniceicoccales bacterium]